jgi:hypothetical protein
MTPHLVKSTEPDKDLEQTITQLLEGVQSGVVMGVIFGAVIRGKRYYVNVSGTMARDPTFARGVLQALDDELQGMVQKKADFDTTL